MKQNSPLRVLIVEDSEDDVILLVRELRKEGFDLQYGRVETAEAMKKALGKQTWDAILSDYSMPRFSGGAALEVLKQSGQDVPFIIVSGTIGEDVAVDAMKSGASDYVLKDNLKRLIPALKRELRDAEARRQYKLAGEEKKKLEEQFRQAQKMEAVGQMAGGIAHDFNNRLTAITNNAFIIRSELAKDDPLAGRVNQILSSAENAANLIRSLLAFSRKQVMSMKPIDLGVLIKEVGGYLGRIIGEDVKLVASPAEMPLVVLADRAQLENVFVNLAVNARDAMPRGGKLTIKAGTVGRIEESQLKSYGLEKAGSYAVVSVSDTGIGMEEAVRTRVFEPFFTTKKDKGTGLGLSTAYGVLKQHGGNITVHSEPGGGTTFRLYLPLAVGQAVAEAPADPPAKGTGVILLADDDPEVRSSTKLLLEHFGYKVIEAEDGKAAVRKFKENIDDISLLMLDVLMPDMSGKDVCEAARKLKPAVKVLFMSGYSADIISSRAMLEEGSHYVPKPAAPGELLSMINGLLGG